MLVTFSGLDGCGKTTLAGLLKASLERREVRATVSHMYRGVGVYALGLALVGMVRRRRGDAAAGMGNGACAGDAAGDGACAAGAKAGRASARTAPQAVWNRSLRLLVYPLDLLIFCCYRLYVEGVRGRVLIMDRYFYDTLVDVSFRQRRTRAARILSRLTPTPSVPVLLDISPAEAFARKGEHGIQFLEGKRTAYRSVFPNGGRGLVLEARRDAGEILRAVESAMRERMEGR